MSLTTRRQDKVFFSHKEASAFTAETLCFIQGFGTMTKPEADYQFESNKMKLGSGEHGTKTEIQAIWTPWSYKCQRLSEIAYMLSYFMGKEYVVVTSGDLEKHEILHLPVSSRTLPTFTFEYGTGTASGNAVYSGCVVNDFTITFANGGNGVVDATFNGWGNQHRKVTAAFALNALGSMSSGLHAIASEPMVNYKCTKFWKADAATAITANSVSFIGEDLGASVVDISTLINSCTITGNNGMNMADMARASGCGIVNDCTRGDRSFSVEMNMRKDNTNGIYTDAAIVANTQLALEIQWNGSYISGTDPYALDIIFPVLQVQKGAEDDGSPLSKTIPFEVFEDSNGDACEIYVQSQVSDAYNEHTYN